MQPGEGRAHRGQPFGDDADGAGEGRHPLDDEPITAAGDPHGLRDVSFERAADVPSREEPHPDEPATDPTPARDAVDLDRRLGAIEAGLDQLCRRLADESDRAAARERIIDRQHEEIQRLRSVERVGQLRPVVTDLCRLRNGLLRQAATVPAEMTGPKVADLLRSFVDEIEEALERCGVVVLPPEPGTPFTPGRQQVAAVVETADPLLDGTVAAVVQDGYVELDGGKVVLPARITVHRLSPKENPE